MKQRIDLNFNKQEKYYIFDKIFYKFYKLKSVQDFILNINSIDRSRKDKKDLRPLSNLISMNIDNNKIKNFKIYCEINESYSDNIILKFIPDVNLFKYYINYIDSSRQSHSCFAIKINRDYEMKQYFHLKIKEPLNEFIESNTFKEKNTIFFGVSVEYFNNTFKKNLYFYYFDKNDIQYFLNKYSINENIENINHMEVTELEDGTQKIIIVFNYNFKQFNFEKLNEKSISKKLIEYFKQKHNTELLYYGEYSTGTTSLYWQYPFETIDKNLYKIKQTEQLFNKFKNIFNI